MATQVFINLPVADVPKSIAFFEALGYSRNPQFSNDDGACIVISDTIFVMVLAHAKFLHAKSHLRHEPGGRDAAQPELREPRAGR